MSKSGNWFIADSNIHGKGVFAAKEFKEGEDIDLCFVDMNYSGVTLGSRLARTEFCSFINHAEPGNSELYRKKMMYILKATTDIQPSQEITTNYNKGLAFKISGGFPHPTSANF